MDHDCTVRGDTRRNNPLTRTFDRITHESVLLDSRVVHALLRPGGDFRIATGNGALERHVFTERNVSFRGQDGRHKICVVRHTADVEAGTHDL